MNNERILLSRVELYKMVWSEPVWTLAKKYGLSDRGLAKICARMEIPVPGKRVLAEKKVRMADTRASFAAIKEIDNQRGMFEEITRAVNRHPPGTRLDV